MKHLLVITSILLSTGLFAQEICNNGIDDDGDGLVDLNDIEDCECFAEIPTSLIPNPSFEDNICCPTNEAQLDCAVGWIQASGPTTDYVHTCGILGNPFLGKNAPVPFPDGSGAIGFRDGKPGQPDFKEYAGSCLNEEMKAGVPYRIDFFVGFPDDDASDEFSMTLFATTNCDLLPFGNTIIGDPGCPTNEDGWEELAVQKVAGNNEWINVAFEFIAEKPYAAIVLGPSCEPHPNYDRNPYFFFDRLLIAESSSFGYPLSNVFGEVCNGGVTIGVDNPLATGFQWYLNGEAIANATEPILDLYDTNPEGYYQVVLDTEEGCFLSQGYFLEIPFYESMEVATLCEGEVTMLGSETISTEGMFEVLLEAEDGCDSMAYLEVTINEHSEYMLRDSFCEGEEYFLLSEEYNQPGMYELLTQNAVGCDSTIYLDLFEIPDNDGVELEDELTVDLGHEIDVVLTSYDPRLGNFSWTNEAGEQVSTDPEVDDYYALSDSWLYVEAIDEYGCITIDSVEIRVQRTINEFVPNIFTPDEIGANDHFKFYGNRAVKQIKEVHIYDRWGELVYKAQNTGPLEQFQGWNGRFNGQKAAIGVYTYFVIFEIVDGSEERKTGSITLVR